MALDFIELGGCGGRACRWGSLAGGNLALPIGVIVRAMVALCSVSQAGEAGDLRQQSAVATTSQ